METIPGDSNWRTWSELTVALGDVPANIETGDLYQVFAAYGGEIIYVEILESSGGRGLTARVRFSPLPSKAFWEAGTTALPSKDAPARRVSIRLEPPRRSHDGTFQSPVNPRIWYPAVTKLFPRSMEFGVMADEKAMHTMKKIKPINSDVEDEKVKLTVDLIRKKIDISFGMEFEEGRVECYKFHLEFSTLKRVYWHHVGGNLWALVIPTDHPPAYFWRRGDLEGTFSTNRRCWRSRDLWCRSTDILTDMASVYQTPVSLPNEPDDPNFINLGRWTSFRFITENSEEVDLMLRSLGDFNISIETCLDFTADLFKGPSFWSLLDAKNKTILDDHLLANFTNANRQSLSFELRYQLEVCISRGIFSEYQLGLEFLQKLGDLDITTAKYLLEHVSDVGKSVTDPMAIFENEGVSTSVMIKSKPVAYPDRITTRKVIVTPTAIYLTSPTPEIANRILRKYRDVQDRFLRVQFTGELLEGRINSRAETDRDDEVYKRVYRVLDKGIRIGDRHFEFLAFGNSQMRENGAYFFASTDHISCDDIRQSMGSFGHIRSVAKYAARMGQCFSTTREVRTVKVPAVRSILDIEHGGYCFTDGVGKVSMFLADMAANEMGLGFQIRPSAYQFRMGGCKGVLAVWPDAKKSEVHIRKSQAKFTSESSGLEVIRCAQFATATLNRQTITILSSLGVRNKAFIDLLHEHLDAHTKAELDSRDAITLLRQHVDENQTTLMLARILLHGFKEPDVQEPFVLSILNLWKIWSLKLVKEKARIPVQKSAFVLGCADETGTLRGHSKSTEGSKVKDVSKLPQIFLQVSDPEEPQKSAVVTGVCIVGRNPSLHPGDIRVVEAVDVPGLRHLRDVVVFPTRGDRDVPSMLSGGDLDGDDFFVIWDSSLLPPEWNHPPMVHLPVEPKILNRGVNTRDLRTFFVKYMKNDILPTVALAHLALADYFDDGAKNEKCLALAQLHSKAVDYVKSGEPAEMDKSLRPRRWPTFMEKRVPKEMTYNSEKALGIIYAKVHSVAFNPTYSNSFDKRILDKCVKDTELLKRARQIKSQYDTALRRIMGQREIATEFEIWSGFVLSRPRVGSGYKLQEDIGREYGSIKMTFREMCQRAAGSSSAPRIDAFVAAMYKVTQEEVNIALHERRGTINLAGKFIESKALHAKSMPLISFPWIFHEVLCRLATSTESLEVLCETKPQDTMGAAQDPSTDGVDGNHPSHLNDGRIMHQGEVLNMSEPGVEEEKSATLPQSKATAQAGSDVQAGGSMPASRSEAGSDLSMRFLVWHKTRIRQRAIGEPDARTLMMSQIEKDLADMKMGNQVKAGSRGSSVVSAPGFLGEKGATSPKSSPGLPNTNRLKTTWECKAEAAETEDLLDLWAGSEESKGNCVPVTGQEASRGAKGGGAVEARLDLLTHGLGGTCTDGDGKTETGRHDARGFTQLGILQAGSRAESPGHDGPRRFAAESGENDRRNKGPLGMVPKGGGMGMRYGNQGTDQGKEENRQNASTGHHISKSPGHATTMMSGAEARDDPRVDMTQSRPPYGGRAVEGRVHEAPASAELLGQNARDEVITTHEAGAGKMNHGRGQEGDCEVIEAKESSAIDLLLDL